MHEYKSRALQELNAKLEREKVEEEELQKKSKSKHEIKLDLRVPNLDLTYS